MWRHHGRYLAGLVACLVMGTVAFVADRPVPLLAAADLGFHELGHLVAIPLGQVIHFLAGSVTQVLVPAGLAGYFLLRKEFLGTGLCLAWAGTSAHNASVYIADAPYERLPLIGGHHDWAFLLGRWDALEAAGTVAGGVRGLGLVLVLAGVAACVWPLLPERRLRPVRAAAGGVRRPRRFG